MINSKGKGKKRSEMGRIRKGRKEKAQISVLRGLACLAWVLACSGPFIPSLSAPAPISSSSGRSSDAGHVFLGFIYPYFCIIHNHHKSQDDLVVETISLSYLWCLGPNGTNFNTSGPSLDEVCHGWVLLYSSEVKTEKVLYGELAVDVAQFTRKANPDHATCLSRVIDHPPVSFTHVINDRSLSLPQIEHIGSRCSTTNSQVRIASQTVPFGSRRSQSLDGWACVGGWGTHRRLRKGLYCK